MKSLPKILFLCAVAALAMACETSEQVKLDKKRAFSVSAHDKVVFAEGNLQFLASEGEWRFALKQYDCIGTGNTAIGPASDEWIDLFAWGATGADGIQPYDTDGDYRHYIPQVKDIAGTERDWGIRTSRGFFAGYNWYTLSRDEWDYLLTKRTNASKLFSRARVADVDGLMLLPDKWKMPKDSHFTPKAAAYAVNVYTATEWEALEAQTGAVFLPAAGYRSGTSHWTPGGCYWTTTVAADYDCYAYELLFNEEVVRTTETDPTIGRAVRLVRKIN